MAERRINYSNREIDLMFDKYKELHEAKALEDREWHARIEVQTIKHNGRLTRMERVMLIFGTALLILLVTNGSQLVEVFKIII